jgi:hypothetical protein
MRVLLAVALLGLGCAVPYRTVILERPPMDPWTTAPAHAARVCALRPSWLGGTIPLIVHDEGRLVGALGGNAYVCWLAAPGRHHVTAHQQFTNVTMPRAEIELDAEPGGRAYLELSFEMDGTVGLDWLDEADALEHIERCDWEQIVAAPAGERLPPGGLRGGALMTAVPLAPSN